VLHCIKKSSQSEVREKRDENSDRRGDRCDRPGRWFELLGEVVRLRGIAQDCAKDVANYYHPKLASVTHKGDAENALLGPVTDTDRLKAMIEFLLANPEVLKHPQISKMLQ
jgi:hypothetical protein